MLALTHISPRYGGKEVRDEARAEFQNTVVPRDFDRIEIPFPERGEPALVKASEQELVEQPQGLVGPLEEEQVPGAGHDLEPGAGDAVV